MQPDIREHATSIANREHTHIQYTYTICIHRRTPTQKYCYKSMRSRRIEKCTQKYDLNVLVSR